jgi:hypothetical protein
MAACSHCGAELPADATFCPACGRRTADLPADETVRGFPIDVHRAEPRWFGLEPPVLVLAVMAVLLVLGIVLLATGSLAVGVIAIVLAACLLPSFLAGARRWPDTPFARVGLSTAGRVRDEADVAVASISTWSSAGRDVVRLRKEQFQLRRDRDAKIRELGVSVYEGDGRADDLHAAAKELDERIEANERELQRTVAGARRRVKKGRAAVATTQIIRPEDSGPLTGQSPDHEGEPVDADHVGLDPEHEDGGERGAEPGSATEGDAEQGDAPGDERKHSE